MEMLMYIAGGITSLVVILKFPSAVKNAIIPAWNRHKQRKGWRDRFMRDWMGEPAEPGRDAVPGVMERLNRLDGELSHNGGKSIKDVVDRLEEKMDNVIDSLQGMSNRIDSLETKVTDHISNPSPREA